MVGVRATTPSAARWRSARTWWSARTAGTRSCGRAPGLRSGTSARRWTCCGSGSRASRATPGPMGRFARAASSSCINRGDYWQCGYVIPKGGSRSSRRRGLEAFREGVAGIAPFTRDRVDELRSWDDVKLLTVGSTGWRAGTAPGLLCIGDAAHAMSPVGGVGINLAVQDAVAAANLLAEPLREGRVTTEDLARGAAAAANCRPGSPSGPGADPGRVIARVLGGRRPLCARRCRSGSWRASPSCRGMPARLVGMGIAPSTSTRRSGAPSLGALSLGETRLERGEGSSCEAAPEGSRRGVLSVR